MRKSRSFESSMAELEGLLNQLSDENTPLETAVALYAKAAEKINSCSMILQDAKLQIEQIDMQLGPKAKEHSDEA